MDTLNADLLTENARRKIRSHGKNVRVFAKRYGEKGGWRVRCMPRYAETPERVAKMLGQGYSEVDTEGLWTT